MNEMVWRGGALWLLIAALFAVIAGVLLFLCLNTDDAEQDVDISVVPEGHEAGYAVYEAACMACHGGEGQGRRGQFPPLVGHVPDMLGRDGGRAYLVDVVLNGVAGPTVIDGVHYDGFMPPSRHLSDEDIAALLNYLAHAWGNEDTLPADHAPFVAAEVAERREQTRSPREVAKEQPR